MSSRPLQIGLSLIAAILLTAVAPRQAPAARQAPGQDSPASGFQEIDRLVSEQKFEEASTVAARLSAEARQAGDSVAWTRALIVEAQLRMALGGLETAVELLRTAELPEAPKERALLDLFYAQSLLRYVQHYSWEIRQRERVASATEGPLDTWTAEQIVAEAHRAYLAVWERREMWGEASLGDLAGYFDPNNYPGRIRGTLRDAVVYLWVELLADSSQWTAAESNGLFRLELQRLLGGGEPPAIGPADLAAHPLARLAVLLADHESWHREADRPEAAFEARRVLVGQLFDALSRVEDRSVLAADLERATEALGRRYEWWSMGRADLAQWRRQAEGPQSLVQARELALEGWQAHPESTGGKRCRHLVAQIEAPDYGIEAMATDAAGKRSILIAHQNLPRLFFRAWALDLEAELLADETGRPFSDSRRVESLMGSRRPDFEWQVGLPETSDYRSHRTFATPPMERPGLYAVVASGTPRFGRDGNQLHGFYFVLGDLVISSRPQEQPLEVTVLSGSTGEPVEGAEVVLYSAEFRSGHERSASRPTDAEGVARFDLAPQTRFFLLARRGDEVGVDPQMRIVHPREKPAEIRSALVFTDRSIYRPGQSLLWKVVAYRGVLGDLADGRFSTAAGSDLEVNLLDPNGEVVATSEVTTNRFGTASGSFEIPTGRLLGSWSVEAASGRAELRVEEYKRPTFEVTLEDPESALRLNRLAELRGEAHYYFGLPVVTGDVTWRVTREPVYPRWWFWAPEVRSELIATGEASLDEAGRFRIAFTPQADEREADGAGVTYRYRLEADVTGEGGETRSAERTFRLGFTAIEALVTPEATFFPPGEEVRVSVARRDLDGSPRAGSGRYRLYRLSGPEAALLPAELPRRPDENSPAGALETEGDRLRARWETSYSPLEVLRSWPDGEEIGGAPLQHGEDGRAEIELGLDAGELDPGAYRFRYWTEDPFGSESTAQAEFLVVGEGALDLPLAGVLLADRSTVQAGERVRLLVHSGLADQPMALEIFRSGRRIEKRSLRSGRGPAILEIPILPEHRGGLAFRWTTLRDHQLLTLEERVIVPWSDKQLTVEFATFRDRLKPGAKETWRVTLRGEEGALAAGSAELLAYMYDRSLDLFAPHRPADPLDLYPWTGFAGAAAESLGTAPGVWLRSRGFGDIPEWPHLQGDRLRIFDAYGIGGPGRRHLMRMPTVGAPVAEMAMQTLDASVQEATTLAMNEAPRRAEKQGVDGRSDMDEATADTEPVDLRSDFSETAFWEPHLVLGEDGGVSFEFEVPDSVTDWNVWVHALTADLRAGSVNRTTKSVKELLVRPYLPRFLREGDQATLRVVINNAGERSLAGRLDFDLIDLETGESVNADFGLEAADTARQPFEVAAGQGTEVAFEVTAPARVGQVAVRVSARAGDLSDGELRALPILPSRIHLAQSRFSVLGREAGAKELRFEDLAADDDPSRIDEQLVVTLDGQLFYGVLRALPYLIDYPYDCTEQLLNRFVSTGVVSSLFDDYPAVASMAEGFAERETLLESWATDDPNRSMALEETPWLAEARGGPRAADLPEGASLVKVLDPRIARATRDEALAKLEKAQTASGGFPWWPGGPPSPYMTIYLLNGFSRALEHGVEVPRPMVERAWQYLHGYYLDELARESINQDCCWESVTFLNYVLSSYPDPAWTGGVFSAGERKRMLDFSYKHWRQHSPLLKAMLALTLARSERPGEAKLLLDSILDSAKTDDQLGTYWAPEDRSWLWYNDTIETHAYILRALTELDPDDARRHGLVQWLFLNKKLNHWKSTRATAEVVYALAHYLDREGTLATREEATVRLGTWARRFVFEPDTYGPAVPHGEIVAGPEAVGGRPNQIVVPGEAVEPAMATVIVEKSTPGLLFASATWHFSTERLPEESQGDFFSVERVYFKRVLRDGEWTLAPLAEGARVEVGDQVQVELRLRTRHAAEYVHLRDPRGAGFEPETHTSGYKWNLGLYWYEEIRDSGTNFFFEWLPVGEYAFHYRLRATTAGTFRVAPATLQPMYAPEFNAYSSGAVVAVEE